MTPNNRCFPRSPSCFLTIVIAVASSLNRISKIPKDIQLRIVMNCTTGNCPFFVDYIEKEVANEPEAIIRKKK